MSLLQTATTASLSTKYYEYGPRTGWPVVLSHGFPYDVHAFDDVVPILVSAGARVIVPYLRGFGPTRFLTSDKMKSGQQAALGSDVIALLDALGIEKAVLAGFDWGGVTSCVGSALWPERVSGLVSYAGYDIVDVLPQHEPIPPSLEHVMWYQHLFQTERGRRCLAENRQELCRMLWKQWSPTWNFDEQSFERTAAAFDNPDFVDVVIHAYRFCHGNAPGDPELEHLEARLAKRPRITVPCITLDGRKDPLKPGGSASHSQMFSGRHERREFDVGHAFPLEAPKEFANAIIDVHQWSQEPRGEE